MHQVSNHNTGNDPLVTFSESDLKASAAFEVEKPELSIYPNPSKGFTNIKFSVGETRNTSLIVYNNRGIVIESIFDGIAEAGRTYKIGYSAYDLSNGIYIVRLQSGNDVIAFKKLIISK